MMRHIPRYLVYLAMITCSPSQAIDVSVFSKLPATKKENEEFLKNNIVNIFTLKTRSWSTGERLQVFILPKDSIYTQVFTKKYLKMTSQSYFDILESNQASGRGQAAVIVESQSDLVFKILNTRGSIGYADESVLVNLGDRVYIIK